VGLVLLVGGARSGKSTLAVEMGRRHGAGVVFIATAPAPTRDGNDDPDLVDRIERHRTERPAHWATIEEPTDLVAALERSEQDLAIVDCLTLWVSNLLFAGRSDDDIVKSSEVAADVAAHREVVAVTNEVGSGVHPETELGRRYRDVLGRVNQTWAHRADTTLLLVAGRAVRLDDPWPLLDRKRR
jgi:adenosyl cobinamide kinase/adenosyl cobinamide phosphate guanylyltransferase